MLLSYYPESWSNFSWLSWSFVFGFIDLGLYTRVCKNCRIWQTCETTGARAGLLECSYCLWWTRAGLLYWHFSTCVLICHLRWLWQFSCHWWPFVFCQVFNQVVLRLQWEPVLTTLRKALRPTKRRPSKGQQQHLLPRKLKLQVEAVGCVCGSTNTQFFVLPMSQWNFGLAGELAELQSRESRLQAELQRRQMERRMRQEQRCEDRKSVV